MGFQVPQNSVALENNSFTVGHFRYAKASAMQELFPLTLAGLLQNMGVGKAL